MENLVERTKYGCQHHIGKSTADGSNSTFRILFSTCKYLKISISNPVPSPICVRYMLLLDCIEMLNQMTETNEMTEIKTDFKTTQWLFLVISILFFATSNYCQAQKLSKPEKNFEFFWSLH